MMEITHVCDLKEEIQDAFTKVPPNATFITKCYTWLKLKNTVNITSMESKRFFIYRADILAERTRHTCSKDFYIIHPLSVNFAIQEAICWVILTYTFIFVPFYFAFRPAWVGGLLFWIACYSVFIAFNCFRGVKLKNEMVTNQLQVLVMYLKSYCLTDLLLYIMAIINLYKHNSPVLWFMVYVRTFTYIKLSAAILKRIKTNPNFILLTKLLMAITILLHFFACTLYVIPTTTAFIFGKNPGKAFIRYQYNTDSKGLIYYACMKAAATHFFGTYIIHIIKETHWTEELALCVILLCGRLFTLFMWSKLLVIFGIINLSQTKYEEIRNQLYKFMRSNKLPKALRERVMRYYEYKFQGFYFDEAQIINRMPYHMRNELHLFSCRVLLEKTDAFRHISTQVAGDMMAYFEQEIYMPNDIIVRVGDSVDNIYFISFGTLMVLNKNGVEMRHLEDGEQVGLISYFFSTGNKYMFSIVALEISEVYRVTSDNMHKIFGEHPDIQQKFYKKTLKEFKVLSSSQNYYANEQLTETFNTNLKNRLILESLQKRPRLN